MDAQEIINMILPAIATEIVSEIPKTISKLLEAWKKRKKEKAEKKENKNMRLKVD